MYRVKKSEEIIVFRGGNILECKYKYKIDDVKINKKFVENDLLLKKNYMITPAVTSIEHIGKIARIEDDKKNTVVGGFVLMLIMYLDDDTLSKFLIYLISSPDFRQFCRSITKKSGQAFYNLSREKLLNGYIPLPPYDEQKRIVEKLDKIMPLVEKYSQLYELLATLDNLIYGDLKQSILQYAMKGKLTNQFATDGSAKDLLEEIKKENEQLVKGGRINKLKEVLPITNEEKPFELPKKWEWCKFGNIVSYNMGKTPPRAEDEWWGKGINWVSIADMVENGYINTTKEMVTRQAISKKFNNCISKKGTLLMSFKLTVGRVSILNIDAVHNEAIISIYPYCDNNKTMQKYLFNILPCIANNGETKDAIKGKTLNDNSINNLIIPLPPYDEQNRIVEKLNLLEEKLLKLKNDSL